MQRAWAQLAETVVAVLFFVALALLWTFPLVSRWTTAIPGAGVGDNAAGLWNFWWARFALGHDLELLQTPYLFAPHGTSLSLHTNTLLPALAGATVLGRLPLVAAHNTLLIATLALNGLCASWLLRRETGDRIASLLGGTIFAGSPFVAAHLHGHFNVLSAWSLPLVCLAARSAHARSHGWALCLGLIVGVTTYLDYYYAIYAVGIAVVLLALQGRDVRLLVAAERSAPTATDRGLRAGVLAVALIVAAILTTGGATFVIGSIRIGLEEPFNGLQLLGLLVAIVAWRRWRPGLTFPRASAPSWSWRHLAIAAIGAIIVSAPIWIGLGELVWTGDYVSQVHRWRSGAQGVDLSTVIAGPPFHWLAPWTKLVYQWRGMDPIERSGWMGLLPLVLAVGGWRLAPRTVTARWLVVAVLAFLWALGPHLTLFGWNTGFILPNALLRYVPVMSNARIPGRAMVVVILAVAALAALGVAQLRRRGLSRVTCAALAVLVLLELWPGGFPLTELDRSPLYEAVRIHPASGSVLELPMGIRDGFGETGKLDHRALWYQTIHERKLLGGFVARLPRSTARAYATDPLLSALLAASSDRTSSLTPPLPGRDDAARALRALDVRFIVLNRREAPSALANWLDGVPSVRLGTHDGREVYVVQDPGRGPVASTKAGPGAYAFCPNAELSSCRAACSSALTRVPPMPRNPPSFAASATDWAAVTNHCL